MLSAQPEPFTRASDIRKLTPEQAALGYPVKLQGVLTDTVPHPDFFIQDKSAGIYVEGNHQRASAHQVGDLVELIGITGPGRFAPVVKEISSRVIRSGEAMPKTRIYNDAELANGVMDSQWIQLRGVIRSASIDSKTWPDTVIALNIDSGEGQIKARVPLSQKGSMNLASWIGREALFRGVCGSLFSDERQFAGVLLYVPSIDFVSIETRAPLVAIPELLRFSPQQQDGRVRVDGVVSYADPGKLFCIQAGQKGLRVVPQENTPLTIGDEVEVLGWPTLGESAPILTSSGVKRMRRGVAPEPVTFDFHSNWTRYDGALVNLTADLTGVSSEGLDQVLQLRHDTVAFTAPLKALLSSKQRVTLPAPGSRLQLTGVALVRNGGLWRAPQSFQILLRSRRDIKVLSEPSLWNLRSAAWILEGTIGALLLVVIWTLLVRRRFNAQMRLLREKLQRGAVLEERNRIARELHDTLEQDLAGITLHLDLASDCFERAPEQARHALDTARRMSRHSMLEARRSVWDLRSHLLEKGSLGAALAHAAAPHSGLGGTQVDVRVEGKVTRLDTTVEMNVLRIGQEAITNALKHAQANNIQVLLSYADDCVELSVTDDGQGFDPRAAHLYAGAHFGLLDMKERAQLVGSKMKLLSQPGRGTSVEVKVPLKAPRSLNEQPEAYQNPGR